MNLNERDEKYVVQICVYVCGTDQTHNWLKNENLGLTPHQGVTNGWLTVVHAVAAMANALMCLAVYNS